MKPYGQKHKKTGPCACEYCGSKGKYSLNKRERARAKKEIKKRVKDGE